MNTLVHGCYYRGKEVKKLTGTKKFVMLLTESEKYKGQKFVTGKNTYPIPRGAKIMDRVYGNFHFYAMEKVPELLYDHAYTKLREVSIPDDVNVYIVDDGIYGMSEVILGEPIKIFELPSNEFEDNELCIKALKRNGKSLVFVENQTPEICLIAVKQHGSALEFVKEQTPEICLEAVKQYGFALKYVKEQTPEICLEAVKHYGSELEYVKKQTQEICLEAVKRNGIALRYVREQTIGICLEALKQNWHALGLIDIKNMLKTYMKTHTSKIDPITISQNSKSE